MGTKSRRTALQRLNDTLDIVDDHATFEHLLTLALETGFTSMARDIRLIRVRIDSARDSIKRHQKTLDAMDKGVAL